MPKPRFKTLLRQAREQCLKEFDAYDRLTENSCFVGRVKKLKNND